MKKILLILLTAATTLHAATVVRPAPDFAWDGIKNASSLRAVRGQPVVLLIAPSPKSGAFKKQVKRLKEIYQQYAARGVIFAAAFTQEEGVIRSDIPFTMVKNPALVASAYNAEKFAIAIIGKDGNLDYITTKVLPASRVRDVIQNSFAIQSSARK